MNHNKYFVIPLTTKSLRASINISSIRASIRTHTHTHTWVHDGNSTDARQLANLLLSFDMVQHVRGPTHRSGNTLDLVITFADRPPNDVRVDPPGAISDYALVVTSIPVSVDSLPLSERLVRGWRRVDRDQYNWLACF